MSWLTNWRKRHWVYERILETEVVSEPDEKEKSDAENEKSAKKGSKTAA
jgi:hypothetical protein